MPTTPSPASSSTATISSATREEPGPPCRPRRGEGPEEEVHADDSVPVLAETEVRHDRFDIRRQGSFRNESYAHCMEKEMHASSRSARSRGGPQPDGGQNRLRGHLRHRRGVLYSPALCPPLFKLPMVLGHENVRHGSAKWARASPSLRLATRFSAALPSHCAEDCPSCRQGKTNICINGFPRTAGIGGPDGGYAEYYAGSVM